MSELQDLYKLRDSLVAQSSKLFDEIAEVSKQIDILVDQDKTTFINEHPYFRDRNSILYITKNNSSKYIITKITYNVSRVVGISTFASDNVDFLKSYKPTTKLDWDRAITQLNTWLSDANVKLIESVEN